MHYQLEPLPYAYNALEPYIDAKTMEVHHSKHHQTYINKLNEALDKNPEVAEIPLQELLKNPSRVPDDIHQAVINHGGGTYNHDLFWKSMSPGGVREPSGALAGAIQKIFGSYDEWWKQFSETAIGQFGSGWVWLVADANKELSIVKTSNQDSPLSQGRFPLLGIDVWEHAYYLKYQNKRVDYIEAWRSVIDWTEAGRRYNSIVSTQ